MTKNWIFLTISIISFGLSLVSFVNTLTVLKDHALLIEEIRATNNRIKSKLDARDIKELERQKRLFNP